jgi:nucleoside-diphosphate-sugar epimerase
MRILVIGGSRFFGYHLVKKFVDAGHETVLFNRGQTPDDFGDRVGRIKGDRNDRPEFRRKLGREKFDVVIDMIAYRADDSRSAVEAFSGKTEHFFHVSTGAVYTVTKNYPCPLREEDFERELLPEPKEDEGWWSYGYHKRQCEEVLWQAWREQRFPVTILRLPVVMGERDYTLRAYSYFLRLEDGEPLLLPDGGLSACTYVYQNDIVRAVSSNLLNARAQGQAYNLAQEEIVTLRSFVLAAARVLGRQPDLVDVPADVLKAASLGTSFSPLSMRRPFILSADKARRDLSFSSTPFEAWLRKNVLWFRDDYAGGPPDNYALRGEEVVLASRYREAVRGLVRDFQGRSQ